MSDKLAYSVAEAAEALSVSDWLLKEEIRTGRIFATKIGRRLVVPRWALEKRLGMPSVDDPTTSKCAYCEGQFPEDALNYSSGDPACANCQVRAPAPLRFAR